VRSCSRYACRITNCFHSSQDFADLQAMATKPISKFKYFSLTRTKEVKVSNRSGVKIVQQKYPCHSESYTSVSQCMSCLLHHMGDSCRFQDYRLLVEDDQGRQRGWRFPGADKATPTSFKFPSSWNVRLTPRHCQTIKVCLPCSF
jgi:hypothetical protein